MAGGMKRDYSKPNIIPPDNPKKWRDDRAKLVYSLCLLGLTNTEIAGVLEINLTTLSEWIQKRREFGRAVKKGRLTADGQVARALWKRAIGYSYKDTIVFQYKGQIITKEVVKHYPPDVAAIKMWLTNRHPELWADITKTELTANINVKKIDMTDFSEDELKVIEKLGMKALMAPKN